MTNLQYKDFSVEIKSEDVQDGGSFKGYASTFGGKPDLGGDVVVEGAFKETLSKGGLSGFGIAMLYQHQMDKPIGTWTSINEDKRGLIVEGQLVTKSFYGNEAYELMKAGAIKGLSIGYRVPEGGSEYDDKKRCRYLKKLELYEISPVTIPMNTRAQINQVKSIVEAAKDERELEHALREAGLSASASKYIVSLCRPRIKEQNKTRSALVGLHAGLREVGELFTVDK